MDSLQPSQTVEELLRDLESPRRRFGLLPAARGRSGDPARRWIGVIATAIAIGLIVAALLSFAVPATPSA
jgi:hypothetical protein